MSNLFVSLLEQNEAKILDCNRTSLLIESMIFNQKVMTTKWIYSYPDIRERWRSMENFMRVSIIFKYDINQF
jgi:hypothetical protein